MLLLEKAPEEHKGGNSRVSANIVFWPNDVEKAKTYFRALTGPYTDNISDKMIEVWAEEMHANRRWLEGLGMQAMKIGGAEFPEFPGSDCVEMLVNISRPPGSGGQDFTLRQAPPDLGRVLGGERLWKGVTEPALDARTIRRM